MSTYASFQGRVFLGKRDAAGLPIEVRSPGNVAELKLARKTDVLEHYESQTGQRTLDHRMVKQKSATVNLTPEWSLRDSQRARVIRVKPALSLVLHDRESDCLCPSVIHRIGTDRIVLPLNSLARLEFRRFHRERQAIHSELFSSLHDALRTLWAPQPEWLRPPLQRHRTQEADDANHMVGVKVGEEDVLKPECHPVPHHLPLGALTAIEKKRLPLPNEGNGGDIPFNGGSRCRGPEQADGKRHGREIYSPRPVVCLCMTSRRLTIGISLNDSAVPA